MPMNVVMPPVQESGGFRRDLPLAGLRRGAPGIDRPRTFMPIDVGSGLLFV
ncbi:MAG: hypothetical protein IPN98_16840 [Propionivibrio sp.]|nr:hypothetical protein [Propionivibrio sp.]